MKAFDAVTWKSDVGNLHGVIETKVDDTHWQVISINLSGKELLKQVVLTTDLKPETQEWRIIAAEHWAENRDAFKERTTIYLNDIGTLVNTLAKKYDISPEIIGNILNDWHSWQNTNPSPGI